MVRPKEYPLTPGRGAGTPEIAEKAARRMSFASEGRGLGVPQPGAPAAGGKVNVKPLRRLLPYIVRYRGRALAALVALIVAALTTLVVPVAVRRMIDFGFTAQAAELINSYFSVLIAVVGVLAVSSALRYYLVTTLGERIVADLRADVFAHLTRLSPGFFDTAKTGEMISRLTADTTQIKSAVGASVSIALRNLVLFFGGATMMVVTSPRLSLFVLGAIPIIVLPLVGYGRAVRKKGRQAQDRLAEASSYASELIGAIRILQAFTNETMAKHRFTAAVEDAYGAARSVTRARSVLTAIAIFLVFASVVLVLWVGAQDVLAGDITAGRLGQFVLYAVFAAGGLGELSQVWGEISQASGAAERLFEILDVEPEIETPASPVAMPVPARGAVAFDNVRFAYPTRPETFVLDGLSFDVKPGERLALVGPSGAGKSTIFHLILRFYDPASGRVRFDGVDLRQADPAALRQRAALVPQDPVVFASSVADNIRFGNPDAGDDAVRRAAEAAHAAEFIARLPQGYDTTLGERGITLSGGQRQRIAIARAILRDAPLLLLDEATSSLDAESETLVQKALTQLMQQRTSIVIAHRLATVLSCDRILVIDRGRIVEEGTHAQLSVSGGLYARLAKLQFEAA